MKVSPMPMGSTRKLRSSVFEFSAFHPVYDRADPGRDRVWTRRGVHCTPTLEIPSISTMAFSESCPRSRRHWTDGLLSLSRLPRLSEDESSTELQRVSLYRAYHGAHCAAEVLSSLPRSILMAAPFSKASPDRRDSGWSIDMPCFCSAARQLIDQSWNIVGKISLRNEDALSRYNCILNISQEAQILICSWN